jgi:phosphatidylserine/phosphatidylglycerophosphate/cardiolipin synthase-like enzyme
MNPADVEQFLARSLADRKLTKGEKHALADWLARNAKTDQQRGVIRHVTFEIARKAVADPDSAHLIDWLEDVLKVVAPVQAAGGAPAGESSVCFAPGDGCLHRIVHRVKSARRSMDLCVFTVTDDRISGPVLDAHLRGVKVRVISDNEKAHDLGSDVHQFIRAGIPVKVDDVRGPGESGLAGHMHHKFAVFDGSHLLNGSYNWTRGAATSNYENLVETADPELVAQFAAEFERLWNKF